MRSIGNKKLLLALRTGEITFENFVAITEEDFLVRVRYFMSRWRQSHLDEHDLLQEALLAAWRAVDSWDPERRSRKGEPVSIVRYVDYQVGKVVERRLLRELRWPNRDRKVPLPKRINVDPLDVLARIGTFREPIIATDAEPNLAKLSTSERFVAERILGGQTVAELAAEVYADKAARLELRLDCARHAERYVTGIARRATARLN